MHDDLSDFEASSFTHDGATRTVHRKGSGPGVIVIHEVPGITPLVAAFSRRLAESRFTVAMPSLFGTDGKPPSMGYTISSIARACISREFTCLATGTTSPITVWLRALASSLHEELGGPGVGAIGMCLTGGFALAMMVDESVVAPVLSQPSLPLSLGGKRKRDLGVSQGDLEIIKARVAAGCPVLGLRFTGDTAAPEERFDTLIEVLGDGFIAVPIDSPDEEHGIGSRAHSVLTEDLTDEPGHPTRTTLDRVLAFLDDRLK